MSLPAPRRQHPPLRLRLPSMKTHLSPELLEARIAPANFLISSTSLQVLDSAGVNAEDLPNEIAARTSVGATAAVLLAPGDKLFFDANHNSVVDATDPLVAQVNAGKAMVFVRDLNDDLVFDR